MLPKSKPSCCECGKPYSPETFKTLGEESDFYPAYWTDAGILCGPECSTKHILRRIEDGTYNGVPTQPHVNIYQ